MSTSPQESINRYRKARRIADTVLVGHTLTDHGEEIDLPDLLRRADPEMRAKIARAAGQNEPSDATWSLAVELVSIELKLRGGARGQSMAAKDGTPRTLRVIPLRAVAGTPSVLHRN